MYVGVDVGGTKVLAVETDDDGDGAADAPSARPAAEEGTPPSSRTPLPTPSRRWPTADRSTAVGVSVAGLVDTEADRVRYCTHLPWRDDPVRARLADRWGTTVVLENDANCAAVAEREHGAAHGVASFLLVTIGTGIGGAIVHDGRVLRGAQRHGRRVRPHAGRDRRARRASAG